MGSSTNISSNEKMLDAILKVAAEEALKEEMAALPSLDELNKMYQSSGTLEKKIQGIISKEKSKYKRKRFFRKLGKLGKLGKIVAIFIAVLSISAVALISVEASRNFIINTFTNTHNDHVAFEFGENSESFNANVITLGYIPDGFEVESHQDFTTFGIITLLNQEGAEITIHRSYADSIGVAFDNENRDHSIINVDGRNIHIFEAHEPGYLNMLMWQHDIDVITIYSDIDIVVLLRIAENISS